MTVGPGAVRLKGFRGCLENASEYQFPVRSHFFVIKMEVAYRERRILFPWTVFEIYR